MGALIQRVHFEDMVYLVDAFDKMIHTVRLEVQDVGLFLTSMIDQASIELTQDNIIEDAEIAMEIYPTNNIIHGIPHENLQILATGCGNATGNVISLNNDVHNTIVETFKIYILQNIIIKSNDNGSHYQADEVDTNNLEHKEDCTESEVPPYLPEESSDTKELEQEQEEESVEIRETKGKKRKRNSSNWKKKH
ncbi:hypothetical protein QE152_g25110 [Popillia japonica]|uniref:Uncharacterized protein n=1 Tax=Popillia japonica TaxID=7064 RepID=A0AAW1K2H3_POPJA